MNSAIELLKEARDTMLRLVRGTPVHDLDEQISRIDALLKTGGWIPPTDKPPILPGVHSSKTVLLLMKPLGQADKQRIVTGEVSVGHWRPTGGNGNFDEDVEGWQYLPPLPGGIS